MYRPSVVIVDPIGLVYDGDTIKKRALGGSESATCLMARELAKIGFDVTLYNNCIDKESSPGIYDGVVYKPLSTLNSCADYYDIMISLRCITPFVPPDLRKDVQNTTKFDYAIFDKVQKVSKHKILWMHDCFVWGDPIVEKLVINKHIDEIFTLSDFHTMYVSNCWHGGDRRNFEVLKKHIYQTRNGIVKYFTETDISKKDKNLFVYVAAVSKGLKPLLNNVWPMVKHNIPDAKLVVAGGYYKFSSDAPPDQQQQELEELAQQQKYKEQNVTFTGIIPQKSVAELFQKASYFIFPGASPETFGISALESMYYNTPLLTTRFGAMEETAIESANYLLDYAIEPNSLFPNIHAGEQAYKFAKMTYDAYNNPYLHQQKMYACNIVKDIAGWDAVALQWKQHLFKKLGLYLSVKEFKKVSYINDRVHKVFGRRFSNPEEWNTYKQAEEQKIMVITPFYNCKDYILRCIDSVASQNYKNYIMYLIDDASTDGGYDIVKNYIDDLPQNVRKNFVLLHNDENMGAVYNQVYTLRSYGAGHNSIVMLLDGDDALVNDNNIFNFYNNLYSDGKTDFSYGSCWSEIDNIPLVSQPYPEEVRRTKSYRKHKFNWGMPYTHLRTFRYELFLKIIMNPNGDQVFKDETGQWFRAGGDNATFYSLIEQADPARIKVVSDIVMLYNDKNPLNDYKIYPELQNVNASKIVSRDPIFFGDIDAPEEPEEEDHKEVVINDEEYEFKTVEDISSTKPNSIDVILQQSSIDIVKPQERKKKILIAIPTAKNIEPTTFKAIYDLIIPNGYEANFQYFYGYNVDQVRNLIASWVEKGDWDYLFAVDHDISFAPDTLVKMLSHDKDVVSGVYIQRFHDRHVIEIFENNDAGGFTHIPWEKIKGRGLVEIGACGFGCVLVKKKVIVDIGYPQFLYRSALDHSQTFSEDMYFAKRAAECGYKLWCDTSIICDHTGTHVFKVNV
jgi:glycosyltransferase involved in cell wall biosynthesis